MSEFEVTPGQTIGPFFHFGLIDRKKMNEVVAPWTQGAIELEGTVVDGNGTPLPDCMIEIWQYGPNGEIPNEADSLKRKTGRFTGWGRASTDTTGVYRFVTLQPASVNGEPAFFSLTIFARGLTRAIRTRAYLPLSEEQAQSSKMLSAIDPNRRQTVIAEATPRGYRFDIKLQGPEETVFIEFN
jgi:protocatechuate 3,4-dioxygenase, alpha subunit